VAAVPLVRVLGSVAALALAVWLAVWLALRALRLRLVAA
jgi:hypothetical protein